MWSRAYPAYSPEQLTEKLRAIDIQIRWNTRMMALSVPSFNVGCAGIVM